VKCGKQRKMEERKIYLSTLLEHCVLDNIIEHFNGTTEATNTKSSPHVQALSHHHQCIKALYPYKNAIVD